MRDGQFMQTSFYNLHIYKAKEAAFSVATGVLHFCTHFTATLQSRLQEDTFFFFFFFGELPMIFCTG